MNAVRVLAGLALAVSSFLAWTALRNEPLPGCGPESGCGEVLTSRWGYWLGVPVSLGAVPVYVLILGLTFLLAPGRTPGLRSKAWQWLAFCSVAILGAALWFTAVQALVLHRFCPYCMTAHICGVLIAGLVGLRLAGVVGGQRLIQGSPGALSRAAAGMAGSAGLLVVGVLAAGQMLHQPRTFKVSPLPPSAATTVVSTATVASLASPAPVDPRGATSAAPGAVTVSASPVVELHGGAFRFDLGKVPLLGRADAPGRIVSLFDYTCSHCRQLHRPLMEAYRARSNTVAILSLPVPLEPGCNSLVKRPIPEQTNACTYARLGLAVWRADPGKLEAFDDWIFTPPRPPSTNEVRAHAESLVGAGALQEALADSRIDELLQTNIRLYHTNYLVYGKGRLPQLIIGTNLVVGLPGGPEDIYRLLPGR